MKGTLKGKYIGISVCAVILVFGAACFILVPRLSVGLIQANCDGCSTASAIQIAGQMGRLDVVSLCLAFLGIGVGFFAIFSFFAIREDARTAAEDRVRQIISREMDETVQLHVERAVDEKIREYRDTTRSSITEDIDTSDAQEWGGQTSE